MPRQDFSGNKQSTLASHPFTQLGHVDVMSNSEAWMYDDVATQQGHKQSKILTGYRFLLATAEG